MSQHCYFGCPLPAQREGCAVLAPLMSSNAPILCLPHTAAWRDVATQIRAAHQRDIAWPSDFYPWADTIACVKPGASEKADAGAAALQGARDFVVQHTPPTPLTAGFEEVAVSNMVAEANPETPKNKRARKARVTGSKLDPLLSTGNDEWPTPADIFGMLNAAFRFTLDPAATPENAKCPTYFTRETDGLAQPWSGNVWLNPPYSELEKWVAKSANEVQAGRANLVCMLIPARTDTAAWHDFVWPFADEVVLIRGRIKFGDAKASAPFPSCIVIFAGQRHCQRTPTGPRVSVWDRRA